MLPQTVSVDGHECAIALVGNPGVGKSTILNGLAKKAVFKSGLSISSGLTTTLQKYQNDDITLFDTPGIADIGRENETCKQVDAMLRKRIAMKIVFVIKLVHGRARSEDVAVIDMVLRSIGSTNRKDRFGVIVNNVSDGVLNCLKRSTEEEADLRRVITGDHSTCHWCYVGVNDSLVDAEDGMLEAPYLTKFFSQVPITKDKYCAVSRIDGSSFKKSLE